jgi:hypothetical protein
MFEAGLVSQVHLDGSWSIGDKIHGGYLASEIARAALEAEQIQPPFAVNIHYLSAADPGEALVHAETTWTQGTIRQMRARLTQRGEIIADALLVIAPARDPSRATSTASSDEPPTLPPVEDCVKSTARTPRGARVGVAEHLDCRWDPATVGWMSGNPSRAGRVAGWIRRPDHEPVDAYWLLIAGDAAPPLTFDFDVKGWTPTVSLNAHIYAQPAPGWLICEQTSALIAGGWLDETCNLWDSSNRLVASVRQLASYQTA